MRRLGRAELRLPAVVLGTWAMGGGYWGEPDDERSEASILASLDAGVAAFDTAPVYGLGRSERLLGRALRGRRGAATILSKCGLRWAGDEDALVTRGQVAIRRDLSPASVRGECERSLRRLGVEAIDLYQCHWPDPATPIADTMGELLRLRDEGKIRHVGVSNFSPAQLAQAQAALGDAPLASDQPLYSALERGAEADVLPWCRAHGVGVLAYSPLAQGLLTGGVPPERVLPPGDGRAGKPWFTQASRRRVQAALDAVRPIAAAAGLTLGQVALIWVARQPGITAAVAGARSPTQARQNAAAAVDSLDPEALRRVGEALSISPAPV